MKNFVANGKTLSYTVPAETTIVSGQLLNVGGFVGVATTSGTTGDVIEVTLEGVFRFPKATGTGTAFTRGQVAVWAIEAEEMLNADDFETDIFYVGYAYSSASDDDETVDVFLVQAAGMINTVGATFLALPVELSRLAQGGATDGQALKWNNTAGEWQPADDETGA